MGISEGRSQPPAPGYHDPELARVLQRRTSLGNTGLEHFPENVCININKLIYIYINIHLYLYKYVYI